MHICPTCSVEFKPINGNQKYCSKNCKRKYYREFGAETTERQYALISGNWEKYFSRLCMKAFRKQNLTKAECIELLKKQNYKCALSGVELSCTLEKGKVCRTNASIDRIDPKGEYTIDNIQLVCVALNKLRVDMSIDEFKDWCRKVTNYAIY